MDKSTKVHFISHSHTGTMSGIYLIEETGKIMYKSSVQEIVMPYKLITMGGSLEV
ncbi:hypothetical protein [Bacillus sp. FSL K6-3431]|uniref:hypothetical protein n=1 Tax=Bacillus sp. FSL K6-3431 TaxID=2921500 RepID=UPI0030F5FA76